MNNLWFKIFILCLVLTLVLAPFAGFAPLLIFLLGAALLWAIQSVLQVLITGETSES